MNVTALIVLVLKVSIALSVLALGLEATFLDVTSVLRDPRRLGRAILSMNILMPVLALLIGLTFKLHPAVKIALVALAVSPVPPIFPKKAFKAGGQQSYVLGLLVSEALIAIIAVPLTMKIFGRISGVSLRMAAVNVAVLVSKTILAPLLVGIVLRTIAPAFSHKWAKAIGILATALLVVSVIPVIFGSAKAMLSLIGNGTILALAVFALAGLMIGHVLGGPEPENRKVLSLATASRHPGIAVAIAHTNFPGQKLALPAIALYLIIAAILPALVNRSKTKVVQPSETPRRRAA